MTAPHSLRLSHLGLFCRELEPMIEFYTKTMGFVITDRGHLPHAELCFMSRDPKEHHQVVLVTGRPEGIPHRIVNQISFRVDTLEELLAFHRALPMDQVSELDPVIHGISWSLYFRDPEGNRLEVFTDTDWYITQPIKMLLDLTLEPAEIRRRTREYCQSQPGFKPLVQWQHEIAGEIAAKLAASG